jgi:hypothetical protein
MKKATVGVTLVSVLALAMICSCATSGRIPGFYLAPPKSKDAFYGVGTAKMSSLDLSRTTALARARDDVARQVQVSVKNALTDYAQQAGEGDNQQTVQFVETVSRQIVEVTLTGCRTERVEVSDDGAVYALVSYPVENLMEAARARFSRNEAAAFAEFKADEALRMLNDEVRSR